WRRFLTPLNVLLAVALPAAAVLKLAGAGAVWVFFGAGLAIIPLAGLMGHATETLAERFGAGIGGLLNSAFGNAAELITALMVLRKAADNPRLFDLVKASITGSIIGNMLLVLGLALVAGGIRFPKLKFNPTAAGAGTTMLALACAGLIVPTLFYYL